ERKVKVTRLSDQGGETDLDSTTAEQRLGMMWRLALDAWAFKGEPLVELRLQRDVVRTIRGGR
ncbi:MAG: hypothetical protein ACREAC_25165, partial [Blastocatellia bacterium]